MPSTRTSFTCLAKMPVNVPLIVIRLTVISGGAPLSWIVLENDLFQYAAGMGKVSRVKGACSHFAVALVCQLFCDSIQPKGPKESQEKYRQ